MDPLQALMSYLATQAPQAPQGATAPQPQQATPSPAAQALQGIKAPQAPPPVFHGGVSGSGLPFQNKLQDFLTPYIAQAVQSQHQGQVPSLGYFVRGGK